MVTSPQLILASRLLNTAKEKCRIEHSYPPKISLFVHYIKHNSLWNRVTSYHNCYYWYFMYGLNYLWSISMNVWRLLIAWRDWISDIVPQEKYSLFGSAPDLLWWLSSHFLQVMPNLFSPFPACFSMLE